MKKKIDTPNKRNHNLLDRQTDRQSNIELLRILATVGIVLSHATQYMAGGHWWEAFNNPMSINVILGITLGIWGQVSVAVFIATSAYFLCDSQKYKYKSLFRLVAQVIFLNLLVRLFGLIKDDQIGLIPILKCLKNAVISPISGEYWFITGYICLFLLVPILQIFVANVNRQKFKEICIILVVVVTICDFCNIRFAGSVFDFTCCFLVTSYIKKYIDFEFFKKSKMIWVATGLLLLCMVTTVCFVASYSGLNKFYKLPTHIFVNWNVLIILNAISLLWVFKNIKVNMSRIINWLAKCSLGVYLLSENTVTTYSGQKAWLWCELFKLDLYLDSNVFIIKLIEAVAITYVVCVIVDSIRMIVFDYGLYRLISTVVFPLSRCKNGETTL